MKRLVIVVLCVVLAGVCGCGQSGPYAEVIQLLIQERSPYDILYYVLYDIDGNGTKELLIGWDAYGTGPLLNEVYTIQNGAVVRQERQSTTLHDGITLLKNGTIKVYDGAWNAHGDHVSLSFYYYRFEDDALKLQAELYENGEYRRRDSASSPLTPITEEEYDQTKKDMEGDGQTVELDWKPLAEYGR